MTTAIIIILVEFLLLIVAGFAIYAQIRERNYERMAHEAAVAGYQKMIAEKRAELERVKGAIDDTKKENLAAVSGADPGGNFDNSIDILQNLSGNRTRKNTASGG